MEDCGCEEKCFSRIPKTLCERIYESYQKLLTYREKYLYLSGLIYKEEKKVGKLKRKAEFVFHVRVNCYHVHVCQKGFQTLHGITCRDVRRLLKKLNNNVICPDTDDECARLDVLMKAQAEKTSAKMQVEEHVESVLRKAEVRN